jgi:hypothetical protein
MTIQGSAWPGVEVGSEAGGAAGWLPWVPLAGLADALAPPLAWDAGPEAAPAPVWPEAPDPVAPC